MYVCTSIIINSFHLYQKTLFNKGFVVDVAGGGGGGGGGGGRESLKSDWKKQGEGRGQTYLYARSKKKITWFFKQQIEFFVISYLVVAESFIRRYRHFFKLYLFIWTFKYFCCCYRIYICVRNIAIFYSELTKGRFFSLFHSSIFFF